jgi:hypothetical protein
MEFAEYSEFGVVVPGVKMTDALLAELIDPARSSLTKLSMGLGTTIEPGLVALLGDVGTRPIGALFNELSISGVRRRLGAGGLKGENCCAGLGRFLFAVLGRETGVIERDSRSTRLLPPWYSWSDR